MKTMADPSVTDPSVWHRLFEQTPEALRWVFTVLSLGGFGLARRLWKRSQENVERIERQVHRRMDRLEESTHKRMDDTNKRMDEMNHHLIEIAQNTRKQ
jgi:Na+/phosphate symporter